MSDAAEPTEQPVPVEEATARSPSPQPTEEVEAPPLAEPSPTRPPAVSSPPQRSESPSARREPSPRPTSHSLPPVPARPASPPANGNGLQDPAYPPAEQPYDAAQYYQNGGYDYSQYYAQPPASASGSGTDYTNNDVTPQPMGAAKRGGHAADSMGQQRGVLNPQKIYIGGLPEHTRVEDLQDCFSQLGNVLSIELKAGFGFVEFDRIEPAQEAVNKYHGGHFLGAEIRVELSHNGSKAKPYVGGEAGACFKCGRAGHWARDCTAPMSQRIDRPMGGPGGPMPPAGRGRGAYGGGGQPPSMALGRGYTHYPPPGGYPMPPMPGYGMPMPGYDMSAYGYPYGAPPPPPGRPYDDYYRREYGYTQPQPGYPYGVPPPMPGYSAPPPAPGYRPSAWGPPPGTPSAAPGMGGVEPYSPLPGGRPAPSGRRRSLSPRRR